MGRQRVAIARRHRRSHPHGDALAARQLVPHRVDAARHRDRRRLGRCDARDRAGRASRASSRSISSIGTNMLVLQPARAQNQRRNLPSTLAFSDADAIIDNVPNVLYAMPEIQNNQVVRWGNADYQTRIAATSEVLPRARNWPLARGVFFTREDSDNVRGRGRARLDGLRRAVQGGSGSARRVGADRHHAVSDHRRVDAQGQRRRAGPGRRGLRAAQDRRPCGCSARSSRARSWSPWTTSRINETQEICAAS